MSGVMGFHKAFCNVCDKETWHYKPKGNPPAHCTAHSTWNPNRKHAIVGTVMQAQLAPVYEMPTERELRIANRLDRSLWRISDSRQSRIDVSSEDWAQDLFPASEEILRDPNKLYCSFCDSPVDHIHALTEKKPMINRIMESYRTDSGEVIMQEKVVTKVETVHTCPNCCMNIRKPIVVRVV